MVVLSAPDPRVRFLANIVTDFGDAQIVPTPGFEGASHRVECHFPSDSGRAPSLVGQVCGGSRADCALWRSAVPGPGPRLPSGTLTRAVQSTLGGPLERPSLTKASALGGPISRMLHESIPLVWPWSVGLQLHQFWSSPLKLLRSSAWHLAKAAPSLKSASVEMTLAITPHLPISGETGIR